MVFKPILKSNELQKAYLDNLFTVNRQAFRFLMTVSIIYLMGYTVYDRTRTDHYETVFVLRLAQILVVSFGLIITYSKRLASTGLARISLFVTYGSVFLAFLVGHYGGLPPYQLSNTLFLIFYTLNALMSYGLLSKFIQTLLTTIAYVLYSVWLSPEKVFHSSQIAIVITMASFSYIIAVMFERYKQLSFLRYFELEVNQKKVEELSELKTKFLAILSHDLVSPLLTLKGILELARTGNISNEESDAYFKKVEVKLSSAIDLAKNLVGWSRTKLDNQTVSEKYVEVGSAIHEEIDSFREVARQKNIKIELNKPDLVYTMIDIELVKLAVRNIITNAIKFSHPDTVIVISVKVIGKSIEISISDSGVGISQEEMSKLFTLKKSSSKGTQSESGSGIGLYVVKEFVDLANGSIAVKSELGKGTTFTISLPLISC